MTSVVDKLSRGSDWREQRREAGRRRILISAWALVREEGLAALSLRQLASHVGVSPPTLYAYFPSKNAIFDAMYGDAAREFLDCLSAPRTPDDLAHPVLAEARRVTEFCLADIPRHQLLFQHTIPDFKPSPENCRPMLDALRIIRTGLAAEGIESQRHLEMWTAITRGLIDQQIANEPGGDCWREFLDEVTEMFIAHCRYTEAHRRTD